MKLKIYIDNSDIEQSRLDEVYAPISEEISAWIGEKQTVQSLSSIKQEATDNSDEPKKNLGLLLDIKSKHKLKEPLNFLYSIAKNYQCEFVIATACPNSGEFEDVCYFGDEEGKPDLFEVANYIDL